MKPRPLVDTPTLAVAAVMLVGQAALFVFFAHLPLWFTALAAILLMNLSFTVWHEAAHGNFSRLRVWNDALGIVSSVFTLGPGYFARRREHLAHHRWEGDPDLDPVYPRIQCSRAAFPFRLLRLAFTQKTQALIPSDFLPLTAEQQRQDRGIALVALGLTLAMFAMGYGLEWLVIFFVPRAVIFFLHAFYICHLAHAVRGGGFQVIRVPSQALWAYWLSMGQSRHGMHHANPNLPWHHYK